MNIYEDDKAGIEVLQTEISILRGNIRRHISAIMKDQVLIKKLIYRKIRLLEQLSFSSENKSKIVSSTFFTVKY